MCVQVYKHGHMHVPMHILISFCFSPTALCMSDWERTPGEGCYQRAAKCLFPHVLPNDFNACFIYEMFQICELCDNTILTNVH